MPLRDCDESSGVRQVCCRRGEDGGGERKPAEAVQARRPQVRRPIDVRPIGLRFVLSDLGEGRHEVLHQAGRRKMYGAERRGSLRAGRPELL